MRLLGTIKQKLKTHHWIVVRGMLLLYLSLFLLHQVYINLDELGRFLEVGDKILDYGDWSLTEGFIKTHPKLDAPQYYPLMGVFMSILHRMGSSVLAHLVMISLSLSALFLALRMLKKENAKSWIVLGIGIFAVPVIATWMEIRPEIVSLFYSRLACIWRTPFSKNREN